jgi:aldehyde dehydrogenase (NAD+)
MAETVHKNLVGGAWQECRARETFADENPADRGSCIGRFQASGAEDMAKAVDAAVSAFAGWRRVGVKQRQATGLKFLDLLRGAAGELAVIVARENGKTIREARAEVESALAEGAHHVAQITTFMGNTTPAGSRGCMGWTQYEPLGVAGIISPWNFPVNVMCRKTLPALLTGNTVVFKPASYTPWSGVFMAGLFEKAGFPAGVFNCVTGLGSRVGNVLVDDPRVRAISFTGSTEVGKRIQERAVRTLKRTQLELGGKNAAIVMADADQDAALEAVMTAGFACSGQWCTSTSRVLVQKGIYAGFVESLRKRCEAVRVGDPLDEGTDMGPVAGAEQYGNICAHIERAVADGAKLLTGGPAGGALGTKGYFIRPTVFADVTPAMALFRDEVFGPVLAVTPFDSFDEAMRLANDSAYGLSSAVFTRNLDLAYRYIDGIEAGMAHVNIHTGFKDPSLPFGGWKESGSGLPENSRSGLEFFTDRKAVYIRTAN